MSEPYTYDSGDREFVRNEVQFNSIRNCIASEHDLVYEDIMPKSYPCLMEVFIFYDEGNGSYEFRPSFFYLEDATKLLSGRF